MVRALSWADLDIGRTLGEGKAGKVFLASLKNSLKDLPINTLIAIKQYKNWVLDEPGQLERIIREIEIGRKIKHPNLVKTIALIRTSAGNPALVMHYYAGQTLETILADKRKHGLSFDLLEAVNILKGLVAGLSSLHNAGVIHRDIKPANIILCENTPILMDLGVAKSNSFPEQTETGTFLGTLRYAAPEYLFGEEYDVSADIYSIGAIAYELFLDRQFLGNLQHWTHLVRADRVNIHLPKEAIQSIQLSNGVAIAEYVRYILSNTLTKRETRFNISQLQHSLSKKFWDIPFYIEGKVIKEGEPLTALPESLHASHNKITVKKATEILKKKLSTEDIEFLRQTLDNHYLGLTGTLAPFTYRNLPHLEHHSNQQQVHRLEKDGLIGRYYQGGTEFLGEYWIHDSCIKAYRYGYF